LWQGCCWASLHLAAIYGLVIDNTFKALIISQMMLSIQLPQCKQAPVACGFLSYVLMRSTDDGDVVPYTRRGYCHAAHGHREREDIFRAKKIPGQFWPGIGTTLNEV